MVTVPGPAVSLAVIDAGAVRRWGVAALAGLAMARQEIDELNVYPVPDGDTGTNLFLTLDAAARAVAQLEPGADLAATIRELARGALLGARGNSGIILSQLLRGMAGAVRLRADQGPVSADPALLQAALRGAADAAYAAVSRPVEGTMLTVARAAADAAADATGDLLSVARAAATGARVALAGTPQQLDVLARAGVVDAGGRGLCVLYDALLAVVSGVGGAEPGGGAAADLDASAGATSPSVHRHEAPDPAAPAVWGFEVMYLLDADDAAVALLRERLDQLGDSLVVVGGEGLWSVHIHTPDVGAVLEVTVEAGRPHRVRVTALASRHTMEHHEALPARRAVLAVVAGPGLSELCASAGAVVVYGAAGRRATVADLVTAIESSGATEVVLLPNDPHSVTSAEKAASEVRTRSVRVAVVPTRASVQALAALAVHDPDRSFDEDVITMTAAALHARHGAVTIARRHAVTMAGTCNPGDVLGIVEGEFVLVGQDLADSATTVVERLLSSGGELVTLVVGEGGEDGLAAAVTRRLRASRPEVDCVVHDGGQVGYPLLIGVE